MKEHLRVLDDPKLLLEWDYEKNGNLRPEMFTKHSNVKVWWLCKEHKHSWNATINNRSNGSNCPYCKNRRVLEGFNDLKTCSPDIAAQWDYEKNGNLRPEMFTPHSGQKVWWLCKEHKHSWITAISHRSNGRDCPYCKKHMHLEGFNDLKTCSPDIAAQWDYEKNGDLRPEMFTKYSNVKVWWLCKEHKHSWNATIASRSNGSNCPYCQNRKVLEGFNDLKTCLPDIAAQWDYEKNGDLRPEMFTKISSEKVWWLCLEHKHSWNASIYERSINGTNCPYCKNRRVLEGFNDLKTCLPDIAAQWDYEKNGDLRPEMFTVHSNKKVWWRCEKCGHSWITSIYHRSTTNCPYCSHHKVSDGVNDLKTCLPDIAAQWDYEKNGDLRPEMFAVYSNKKVWWRCEKCGHSWKAIIGDRLRRGCPMCNRGFFKMKTHFIS